MHNDEDNEKVGWRGRLDQLKSSTILSNKTIQSNLSGGMMRRLRDAIYPSALIPKINNIQNPYHYAKERMNDLWSLNSKSLDIQKNEEHPLTNLSTLRGAMASYWMGEQLKESFKPTLNLISAIGLSAGATTMMLQTYAETLSAVFNEGNALLGGFKFAVYGGVISTLIKR